MVLEIVPVSPVVMRMPVTLGSVTVWSAEGAAGAKVVSKSSAVVPSKMSPVVAPQIARADCGDPALTMSVPPVPPLGKNKLVSAVGSFAVNVTSKASAVAPSKIMVPAPMPLVPSYQIALAASAAPPAKASVMPKPETVVGLSVMSAHALLEAALSVEPLSESPVPRVMAEGALIEVGQPMSRPTVGVTGRTTRGPDAGF